MSLAVVACRDAEAASTQAAALLLQAVAAKPDLVLGLSTGETMRPLYQRLVEAHDAGKVSFARASALNVDEYLGLSADDPGSFAFFMQEAFYRRVDFAPSRCHIPDGVAPDPDAEARAYETLIGSLGGIDLLLLGLGSNGHIAFNEPGAAPDSLTRVVDLAAATLRANRRHFAAPDSQPRRAITIGIGTILRARRIVVLATGAAKARAVKAMLSGASVADCPAAALAAHPDATLVVDKAAGGK